MKPKIMATTYPAVPDHGRVPLHPPLPAPVPAIQTAATAWNDAPVPSAASRQTERPLLDYRDPGSCPGQASPVMTGREAAMWPAWVPLHPSLPTPCRQSRATSTKDCGTHRANHRRQHPPPWIAGTSPAMTGVGAAHAGWHSPLFRHCRPPSRQSRRRQRHGTMFRLLPSPRGKPKGRFWITGTSPAMTKEAKPAIGCVTPARGLRDV